MKLKFMLMNVVLILPLAYLPHHLYANPLEQPTGTFFSLTEIQGVEKSHCRRLNTYRQRMTSLWRIAPTYHSR
ncbi:hypothetical protein [Photobacterium lutimaris]|uniref:hypothetical protein n=1 Tax=Photobacterium lutimaris TaxID=388278 RepID=UPI0010D3E879|nr:hypothetical protein [Photobacterium lutimaris]TDR74789.1 hypothetical protein DFP78_106120 [Photobacterium lutimaris]